MNYATIEGRAEDILPSIVSMARDGWEIVSSTRGQYGTWFVGMQRRDRCRR